MTRVTKDVARRMIYYAKSVKVTANFFDPRARSAFEFGRQMQSPVLKKINPNFTATTNVIEEDLPPRLIAEFADGSKLDMETSDYSANDLRNIFFDQAAGCEDKVDIVVPGDDDDDEGGAGKKGDKGKGGKK